jgi:hypothetical protein
VPRPYDAPAAKTARWIQFAYFRHILDARAMAPLQGQQDGKLIVLAVDGFVPVGSNGFVYDASRQAGLAQGRQNSGWRAAAESTELGSQCAWTAEHLFGPYFAYSSSC